VSELQKNPELAVDYDVNTIEISVKKKITPHIQDIDKDITKMLKISRTILKKWIKGGFIIPVKSKIISNLEIFPPCIILEQFLNQKNRK
jgi:hypothetical protein